MHVFFLGYPGAMGGANTEAYHTTKLWRAHGIDVTFIPTWAPDNAIRPRLDALGCRTIIVRGPDELARVAGLAGSVVVGMCNAAVTRARKILLDLDCRLAWVNCMTFLFPEEAAAWRIRPAEAYVYQSEFQRDELEKLLIPLGYNHGMGHLIRGALALEEIPFSPRPHQPGQDFWIGRLARPDLDKWSSNHWPLLARVPYAGRRGLAMGWNAGLDRKCGQRPPWAETLQPQQIQVPEFLGRCHAMLGFNGGARENWPRIGLECMAAGVPLVCQNQWGWKEMISDGITGFLAGGDEELAFRLAQLAYDEELRQTMIQRARAHVHDLACPERIGKQWLRLFASLGA
jgi:hypothetical protein